MTAGTVQSQIETVPVGILAETAGVRLLAGVRHHVNPEVTPLTRLFTADSALEPSRCSIGGRRRRRLLFGRRHRDHAPRPNGHVPAEVLGELVGSVERRVAHGALVRLAGDVAPDVQRQRGRAREALAARRAPVRAAGAFVDAVVVALQHVEFGRPVNDGRRRLGPRVHGRPVRAQPVRRVETLAARRARERTPSDGLEVVPRLVVQQHHVLNEPSVAVLARIRTIVAVPPLMTL